MKRLLSILLVPLICFSLAGCQVVSHQPEALPNLYTWQVDIEEFEDEEYLSGAVTQVLLPDVVEVKPWDDDVAEWGAKVYVITDKADAFCVDDEIIVAFRQVQRPKDKNQPVRIIATAVREPTAMYKPIIYFYPEADTVCSAKLMLNGSLTCTYPEHGANGWENFIAQPDGTLIFPDGKEYYALYWEGIQTGQWDFSHGFCVAGEDTVAFLEWALAQQGLTPREANEFIVYWLPILQENPYNVIAFQGEAYTDGAVLEIAPAPDSLLRIFMAYYPSDVEVAIEPQSFTPFVREGFTVVEWGGGQK